VWKVLQIQVQKWLREIKNANDLRCVVLDIWKRDMTWRVVLLENPRSVRKVPDNYRPKIIV
jgi:hypothetical protein